jgi:tetratricopeptide (TPR) repeat protein
MKTFAEAGPNDAEAQYDYAAVLLRQRTGNSSAGDLHGIQALLERAVALAPGLAQAHRELGAVYLEEEDYAGAIRAYERAAQLLPGRCDIHYRLSMAYRLAMRGDKADSERQVFAACRSQQKEIAGAAGITLDQFVSVMRSSRPPDAAAPLCDH